MHSEYSKLHCPNHNLFYFGEATTLYNKKHAFLENLSIFFDHNCLLASLKTDLYWQDLIW
ncbi:hypothetical protein D3C72_913570 [compost metagenome]